MAKILPSLFGLSIENIKQKIEDIETLGYTKNEVIKMIKTFPALFSYSIDNIKQKAEDIVALGYTKDEVIKMTKILPSLFGYSMDNIKQKIEFYQLINIDYLLVDNAKYLMQSVELSYARYEFYKSKNIEINNKNYRLLFISQKKFENVYGIEKNELLKRYDYNDYIMQKEHQK